MNLYSSEGLSHVRSIVQNNSAVCSWKAMAPHSSTLAWKIPWTEDPGRQQSMGSLRVGHGWATSISLFTFMHWRRKWQPTPVFLPGESQGWGSLVGCRLWGRTESDTTEATQQRQQPVLVYSTYRWFFLVHSPHLLKMFCDLFLWHKHDKAKEVYGLWSVMWRYSWASQLCDLGHTPPESQFPHLWSMLIRVGMVEKYVSTAAP